MADVILDENYRAFTGLGMPPMAVPFGPPDKDVIECIHCSKFVGMATNDFDDGSQYVGVFAMYRRGDEKGTYMHFNADDCRANAQALLQMAAYIEKENAKMNDNEPESLADMIQRAGGQFINLDDYMEPDPNEKHQVIWALSSWALKRGINYDSLGFIPRKFWRKPRIVSTIQSSIPVAHSSNATP